ncbi:hypothetical protein JCM17478_20750 [Thermopirellula anaerolimosa]
MHRRAGVYKKTWLFGIEPSRHGEILSYEIHCSAISPGEKRPAERSRKKAVRNQIGAPVNDANAFM